VGQHSRGGNGRNRRDRPYRRNRVWLVDFGSAVKDEFLVGDIGLAIVGGDPTYGRKVRPWEITGMTFFEFYALFGAPVVLLLVVLGVLWLTGLQDAPRDRRHRHHGAAE
jgi:hypothetical protein